MTTFVLKKYNQKENNQVDETDVNSEANAKIEEEKYIEISGSISEIIIKALQSTLSNNVEEDTTGEKESTVSVKTVTTEEINNDPLAAFTSISKNDVVYIQSNGFKTAQEEWFLTNLPSKTDKTFYSVNSLVEYLKS